MYSSSLFNGYDYECYIYTCIVWCTKCLYTYDCDELYLPLYVYTCLSHDILNYIYVYAHVMCCGIYVNVYICFMNMNRVIPYVNRINSNWLY